MAAPAASQCCGKCLVVGRTCDSHARPRVCRDDSSIGEPAMSLFATTVAASWRCSKSSLLSSSPSLYSTKVYLQSNLRHWRLHGCTRLPEEIAHFHSSIPLGCCRSFDRQAARLDDMSSANAVINTDLSYHSEKCCTHRKLGERLRPASSPHAKTGCLPRLVALSSLLTPLEPRRSGFLDKCLHISCYRLEAWRNRYDLSGLNRNSRTARVQLLPNRITIHELDSRRASLDHPAPSGSAGKETRKFGFPTTPRQAATVIES